MTMRLTSRDLALIRWINGCGFVTIALIAKKLGIAKPTAYGRIRKLVENGFLCHETIFNHGPGIYRAKLAGVQISGSILPPLKKVTFASYYHDLRVTELSLQLCKQYNAEFIPERELRHEDGKDSFGRSGHLSDGILIIDDKRIAIEVELSKKSQRRREKIMKHYMKDFSMSEVWYFCGNKEVFKNMQKMMNEHQFLKVHDLYSMLGK